MQLEVHRDPVLGPSVVRGAVGCGTKDVVVRDHRVEDNVHLNPVEWCDVRRPVKSLM